MVFDHEISKSRSQPPPTIPPLADCQESPGRRHADYSVFPFASRYVLWLLWVKVVAGEVDFKLTWEVRMVLFLLSFPLRLTWGHSKGASFLFETHWLPHLRRCCCRFWHRHFDLSLRCTGLLASVSNTRPYLHCALASRSFVSTGNVASTSCYLEPFERC